MFATKNTEYVTKFVRNDNQIFLNYKNLENILNNKIKQAMIIGSEKEKIKEFMEIV